MILRVDPHALFELARFASNLVEDLSVSRSPLPAGVRKELLGSAERLASMAEQSVDPSGLFQTVMALAMTENDGHGGEELFHSRFHRMALGRAFASRSYGELAVPLDIREMLPTLRFYSLLFILAVTRLELYRELAAGVAALSRGALPQEGPPADVGVRTPRRLSPIRVSGRCLAFLPDPGLADVFAGYCFSRFADESGFSAREVEVIGEIIPRGDREPLFGCLTRAAGGKYVLAQEAAVESRMRSMLLSALEGYLESRRRAVAGVDQAAAASMLTLLQRFWDRTDEVDVSQWPVQTRAGDTVSYKDLLKQAQALEFAGIDWGCLAGAASAFRDVLEMIEFPRSRRMLLEAIPRSDGHRTCFWLVVLTFHGRRIADAVRRGAAGRAVEGTAPDAVLYDTVQPFVDERAARLSRGKEG